MKQSRSMAKPIHIKRKPHYHMAPTRASAQGLEALLKATKPQRGVGVAAAKPSKADTPL